MFKFVSLLAVISCVSAGVLPPFLQVPKLDGRIVGGQATSIEKHPYQVSLMRKGRSHFCGGSLVSTTTVVTAGHCLQGSSSSQFEVRLGSTNHARGGIVVGVSYFKIHPEYNSRTLANDIAVIILKKPVEYTKAIKPVKLGSIDPVVGTKAVVTGWGTLKEGGSSLPTTLREVSVDIISRQSCQRAYGSINKITDSMICAASVGKDSCQGDSGGPLVADGKQIGVVSWGVGCARPEYPGVYGNVAELIEFVLENGVGIDRNLL